MGNCMTCHSQPKMDGREMEIDASVPDEKMNNASCGNYIRKLQNGEVYHFAPFLKQSVEPTTDNRKLKTRKVKIVVTTEQLKMMLSGSNMFQIKVRDARVSRKWRPSLSIIEEVQNC